MKFMEWLKDKEYVDRAWQKAKSESKSSSSRNGDPDQHAVVNALSKQSDAMQAVLQKGTPFRCSFCRPSQHSTSDCQYKANIEALQKQQIQQAQQALQQQIQQSSQQQFQQSPAQQFPQGQFQQSPAQQFPQGQFQQSPAQQFPQGQFQQSPVQQFPTVLSASWSSGQPNSFQPPTGRGRIYDFCGKSGHNMEDCYS